MHAHQCLHSFLMCLNKLILRHNISSSFIPFGWKKLLLSFVVLRFFFVVICCYLYVLCCPLLFFLCSLLSTMFRKTSLILFLFFWILKFRFCPNSLSRGNSLFSDWKGQKIWRSGRATMSRQIQCEELVLSQMQTKTCDFQRK